ncbi:MAG TPA: arginase family protein [Longimicrobiales bacterium]|nr:arginase family protein [Longimicrobiales bacterium]
MLSIDLITVPYDTGRRGWRMGAGPQALLRAGLMQTLRSAGHDVELIPVESTAAGDDLSTSFDLATKVARVARSSRASRRFPLTLSGNCFSTIGSFGSVDPEATGVLWLDAHGDLNTPETSTSGFLDGMSAAALLGWCHVDRTRDMLAAPLAESRLMLAGTRDLDPAESAALQKSSVRMLSAEDAKDETAAAAALDAFAAGITSLYLHVDLDVLDPERVGRANEFASPGGLTSQDVVRLANAAASRLNFAGMTLSAYDPAMDTGGAVGRAALEIIAAVVTAAAEIDHFTTQ